jgi:hypothetical protein
MTHSFATLPVSQPVFDEIHTKLKEAGYDHLFLKGGDGTVLTINMHGIGLTPLSTLQMVNDSFSAQFGTSVRAVPYVTPEFEQRYYVEVVHFGVKRRVKVDIRIDIEKAQMPEVIAEVRRCISELDAHRRLTHP